VSKYKRTTKLNQPMTAREKAAELIVNYQLKCKSLDYQEATQCALIAADEIFQFMKDDDNESETCYWANHPKATFWTEVEQEIKNMHL
jgi:hypothetical protein